MSKLVCPRCKSEKAVKIIYAGFPMKLCPEEGCHAVCGFWSHILFTFSFAFNGVFIAYEGSYWKALWYWMFGEDEDEDDEDEDEIQ